MFSIFNRCSVEIIGIVHPVARSGSNHKTIFLFLVFNMYFLVFLSDIDV